MCCKKSFWQGKNQHCFGNVYHCTPHKGDNAHWPNKPKTPSYLSTRCQHWKWSFWKSRLNELSYFPPMEKGEMIQQAEPVLLFIYMTTVYDLNNCETIFYDGEVVAVWKVQKCKLQWYTEQKHCHCVSAATPVPSPRSSNTILLLSNYDHWFSLFSAHLCMTAGLCKWPHWTPNCCPLWPRYLLQDLANLTRYPCPVPSRCTVQLFEN